jgi:PPOX class probable FMN-dependent enzyme
MAVSEADLAVSEAGMAVSEADMAVSELDTAVSEVRTAVKAAERFDGVITSEAELRAVVGEPAQRVRDKVIQHLDQHCREFIARSPFLLISSADGTGNLDVSPKGDPAGFVQVLDDHTLAIPDRPGNRRVDTFRNLLQNPKVGLIFLIPGKRETLRVSGTATLVRDAGLRQQMAVGGRVPELALVVSVERALFHCAKCMIRSGLWQPDAWPDTSTMASPAEILVAHARLAETVDEIEVVIEHSARELLY